jgi:hypothetical protein
MQHNSKHELHNLNFPRISFLFFEWRENNDREVNNHSQTHVVSVEQETKRYLRCEFEIGKFADTETN